MHWKLDMLPVISPHCHYFFPQRPEISESFIGCHYDLNTDLDFTHLLTGVDLNIFTHDLNDRNTFKKNVQFFLCFSCSQLYDEFRSNDNKFHARELIQNNLMSLPHFKRDFI